MAGQSNSGSGSGSGSPAGRIAREVSSLQASLLAKLREELGDGEPEQFAEAAERLADRLRLGHRDRGRRRLRAGGRRRRPAAPAIRARGTPAAASTASWPASTSPATCAAGSTRWPRPTAATATPSRLAVFDASGPGTRNGDAGGGQETVLAIVGAALRDSIRIVDEAFRLEEDAICVLAPNLRTVEAVQMAERLLGQLDELERAGGLRIAVSAGVVACPDHGADVEALLHKADAAMWRARAVGQPLGVGALQDR